jgi:hypothetical protein
MKIARTSLKRRKATEAQKRRFEREIHRSHVKTSERQNPQYKGLVSGRPDKDTRPMTQKTGDEITAKRSEEENDMDRDYHPLSRSEDEVEVEEEEETADNVEDDETEMGGGDRTTTALESFDNEIDPSPHLLKEDATEMRAFN